MKTISVRDLQKNVKDCVDESQKDRVVITRHGKPTAVLVGVEGEDWEDVVLQTDPAFWRLIRSRRKQETISLDELKEEVTRIHGIIGARSQAMKAKLVQTRDAAATTEIFLSQARDLDYAEAVTLMQTAQTRLQASLQTSSVLLNLSLLDFLR